jgi:hypothetical protein
MNLQARLHDGVMAGSVAAASTTGALLMFGHSLGDPLQAFSLIGHVFIGPGAPTLAASVGVAVHVAVVLGWGILTGLAAPRSRGLLPMVIAVLVVTLAAVLVHEYLVLPEARLGAGLGGPRAPSGPVIALHLLFALSLLAGLLLARRRR